MFCIHCGAKQPDGAKFCDQCGAALPVMAAAPSPQDPPAPPPVPEPPAPPTEEPAPEPPASPAEEPAPAPPAEEPVPEPPAPPAEVPAPEPPAPPAEEPVPAPPADEPVPEPPAPPADEPVPEPPAPPAEEPVPEPPAPPAEEDWDEDPDEPAAQPGKKRRVWLAAAVTGTIAILAVVVALLVLSSGLRDTEEPEEDTRKPASSAAASSEEPEQKPADESSAVSPDADLNDYTGLWHVPGHDGTTSGICYNIVARPDGNFTIQAEAFYQSGNKVVLIDPVLLTVNGDRAAAEYTEDSWGNHGSFDLTLRGGSIRITVTASGGEYSAAAEDVILLPGPYAIDDQDASTPSDGEQTGTDGSAAASAQQTDAQLVNQAFESYLYGLVSAINQNDFTLVASTMVPGSSIYKQQEKLVTNLNNRGITESVVDYSVISSNAVSANEWALKMNERINVHYSDGTTKLVEQQYTYVLNRQSDGSWLLSDLHE